MIPQKAAGKGHEKSRWMAFSLLACLGLGLLFPSAIQAAGFFGANNNHFTNLGAPAPEALPQLKGIVQGVSGIETLASDNKLEVHQDEEKAIIEWESFDIGENAWTHFDQQGNADWVALNRIFDQSPSRIFGRLTADGKIYLINQNGILFGPNARVNVHSLIASSLNIDDELIGGGTLRFRTEDYQNDPGDPDFLPGPVCNWALSASDSEVGIHAAQAGSVLLIAPEVSNQGYITAPSGQIALAAGQGVEVKALEDRTLPHVLVTDTGDLGVAVNRSGGLLIADAGVAGMYGRIVRQEGLIRSVTAVEAGGSVELLASEGVLLGPDSLTATPITSNPEAFHQSFVGAKGDIRIGGLGRTTENNQGQIVFEPSATQHILHQGEILAPSGNVDMSATEWVYLDQESRIDVSGEWIQVMADAAIIGLQLNTMELKNDYGQQGGVLQGQEVQIAGYQGSSIGDLSAAVNAQYLSALEMNTTGGEITIRGGAENKLQQIVMRKGAVIDIAGGGKIYTEGQYDGTKLLAGNRVYDLSEAPEWYRYEKILGKHQTVHERYGLTDLFEGLYLGGASPTSDFLSGHVEGHDAGTLTLEARGVVLNGTLIGSAQAGLYQTELAIPEEQIGQFFLEATRGTRQPRGGRLVLGVEDTPPPNEPFDLLTEEVVIASESAPLGDGFQPGDEPRGTDPGETPQTSTLVKDGQPLYRTVLSAETLNRSGLSDLRIYTNTQVTIEEGARLTLSPGGYLIDESVAYQPTMDVRYHPEYGSAPATLTIWAKAFENRGTIDIPSGRVFIRLKDTVLDAELSEELAQIAESVSPEPFDPLLPSRAVFWEGSTMSVAGEKLNNLYAGRLGTLETGFIDGGTVSVVDETFGGADLIVLPGAVFDVSAGYELTTDGDLRAGEAGSLHLAGSNLLLFGDLKGYGLPGHPGGELEIHSTRLSVLDSIPRDDIPRAMQSSYDQENVATNDIHILSLLLSILQSDEGFLTSDFTKHLYNIRVNQSFISESKKPNYDLSFDAQTALFQEKTLKKALKNLIEAVAVESKSGQIYGFKDVGSTARQLFFHGTLRPELEGNTYLFEDQLADTGFGRITLKSFEDLTFEDGVHFSPSSVKLSPPGPDAAFLASSELRNLSGTFGLDSKLESKGLVRVPPQLMGETSLTASAGEALTGAQESVDFSTMPLDELPRLLFPKDAAIELAPGGSAALSGQGSLDLEGSITAPAGNVSLTSARHDVILHSSSKVDAVGLNMPEGKALFPGLPAGVTPLDGGVVSLSAKGGSVDIQSGALIDVSGSEPIEIITTGGGLDLTLSTATVGSHAGALEVTYREGFTVSSQASIQGEAEAPGSRGGELALTRLEHVLSIDSALFGDFATRGFDSFTFRSQKGLEFKDSFAAVIPGDLTLDAPLITGVNDARVFLAANQVTLANAMDKFGSKDVLRLMDEAEDVLAPGTGTLSIYGGWVDIKGKMVFSGFEGVHLASAGDMRVFDEEYIDSETRQTLWSGELLTEGNLKLTASRIYPAMHPMPGVDEEVLAPSAFTFRSRNGIIKTEMFTDIEPMVQDVHEWFQSGTPPFLLGSKRSSADSGVDMLVLTQSPAIDDIRGTLGSIVPTLEPYQNQAPILSAGGVLVLVAPQIEHHGNLAAPLGQIILAAAPLVEDGGELTPARNVLITARDGLYKAEIEVLVDSLAGASGSVVLGAESITTAHSEVQIPYGLLQGANWKLPNKHRTLTIRDTDPNNWPDVSSAPDMGITIRGSQVELQQGVVLDASGGGGVYASEFLPGLEGLANPLDVAGRSVILPGASFPGRAVHLAGGAGLPEGDYTLLPSEYAFLPGAFVIEDQGPTASLETSVRSLEGYPAVLGYELESRTASRSSGYRRYTIRPAQEVLEEGTFQIAESIAGSAGKVSILGETVALGGSIALESLPLFEGGSLELGGKTISVSPGGGLGGTLQLDAAFFDGMDLEELRIGAVSTAARPLVAELETEEIQVRDSILTAPEVTLAATHDVVLHPGSEIHAVDESVAFIDLIYQYTYDPAVGLGIMSPKEIHRIGEGTDVAGTVARRTAGGSLDLRFYTEDGSLKWVAEQEDPDLAGLGFADEALTKDETAALTALIPEEFHHEHSLPQGKAVLRSNQENIVLHEGSLVHATDEVELDGQVELLGGRVEADNSTLTLAGENVYFVPDPKDPGATRENGLYLNTALFDALNAFDDLTLRSGRYMDTDGDGAPDTLVSGGDLVFEGGFELRPTEDFTLQAARIAGLSPNGFGEATTITGAAIHLKGTSSSWVYDASSVSPDLRDNPTYNLSNPDDLNDLVLHASSEMTVGGGHLLMDGFETIRLESDTTITFQGEGSLTADFDGTGTQSMTFDAPVVTASTAGSLTMEAEQIAHQGTLDIPGGHIMISAAGDVELLAGSEILARGGIIAYPLGSPGDDEPFEPTSFRIVAGAYSSGDGEATERKGKLDITGGGGSAEARTHEGETVTVDVFQGGSVTLESGQGDVLREGSALIDVSNDDRPAEEIVVALLGDEQATRLAEAGLLDAGSISISAPNASETAESALNLAQWNLLGASSSLGSGGRFSLDTGLLTGGASGDLGVLSRQLEDYGFTSQIAVRTQDQGLHLGAAEMMKAHNVKLVADGGSLVVEGKIDARVDSDSARGRVELFAWNNLSLSGEIDARNNASKTRGEGGEIYLSAGHDNLSNLDSGKLDFAGTGRIRVGGSSENGTVRFRAHRFGDESKMTLQGWIEGASNVTAETVQVYTSLTAGKSGLDDAPASVDFDFDSSSTIGETLVLTGVEIRSDTDLILQHGQDWDLSAIAPGVLTFRAAEDLKIEDTIYDDQTSLFFTDNLLMNAFFAEYLRRAAMSDASYSPTQTWGINLVAGSDLESADISEVNIGTGDLYIGGFYESDQGTIEVNTPASAYTENAPLLFAAGRDVFVGSATKKITDQHVDLGLTLGTFAGPITGSVGRDLRIQGTGKATGGVIQSATGNIKITVGRDLLMDLSDGSAIRTTGIQQTLALNPDLELLQQLNTREKDELIDFIKENSLFVPLGLFYDDYPWPQINQDPLNPVFYPELDILREDLTEVMSITESDNLWDKGAHFMSAYDGGRILLNVARDLSTRGSKGIRLTEDSPTYWDRMYHYEPQAWRIPTDWNYTPEANEDAYMWAADYTKTGTAGVATMAGGDLFIRAGSNVQGQIGTFKEGTLSVVAGADLGGFYQVADGTGVLSAGNVTSHFEEDLPETSLSLIRGEVDVMSRGDLTFGTAFNPTFVLPPPTESDAQGSLTYSYARGPEDNTVTSALRLSSNTGDVTISGLFAGRGGRYAVLPPILEIRAGEGIQIVNSLALTPAPLGTLNLTAGGDIDGGAKRSRIFVSDLDPGSVYYPIDALFSTHQDLPALEETVPGKLDARELASLLIAPHTSADAHAAEPIHLDDPHPLEIRAGGDIRELVLYSPKATQIRAEGDIRGLHLISQNLDAEDVTSVQAGGVLNLNSSIERVIVRDPQAARVGAYYTRSGLLFGGPGTFFVQAGETIQLGMTQGLRTTGNAFNAGLDAIVASQEGAPSSLIVISGWDKPFEEEAIWGFFEGIQTGGEEYSSLLAAGDAEGAAAAVQGVEEDVIQPLFDGAETGQGHILMTSSQISTEGTSTRSERETQEGVTGLFDDSSDIYILARGSVNVGLTTIPEPGSQGTQSNTGLFTAQGGDIKLFAMGDLDVNESRMMTFRGGDILVWSHEGNINAGRGSKTSVSAQPPRRKPIYAKNAGGEILWANVNGEPQEPKPSDEWADGVEIEPVIESYTIEFKPPAVGSGIRTVTYDPDGAQGPMKAPALGDAYLFAPTGIIDAGEAGIAARNVVLGATEVVNAQNISFTAGSVGVPTASGGANLGALSGMGGLSETDEMASQTSSMAAEKSAAAQEAAKLAEAFAPKWLDVKVISFDELEEDEEQEKE